MYDFQISLQYIDCIPESYFSDFVEEVGQAGVNLHSESRENVPYAALEWLVPTAVAIYVTKPFVDAVLKRAADDFGNLVYPKLKNAVKRLVSKLFIHEPLAIAVVTSTEAKKVAAESIVFSIYASGADGSKMKFIFTSCHDRDEYSDSIDALFNQLVDFHNPDVADSITSQLSQLSTKSCGIVILLYSATLKTWSVVDPIDAVRAKQAQQKAVPDVPS